jgi:hypothetical protein
LLAVFIMPKASRHGSKSTLTLTLTLTNQAERSGKRAPLDCNSNYRAA